GWRRCHPPSPPWWSRARGGGTRTPGGKWRRGNPGAPHRPGTNPAGGTNPSRSMRRTSHSPAHQNTGQTRASPSHDRYIIGCATRIQFTAGRKNAKAPRYAAKYRRFAPTGARTSVSHGGSATYASGPRSSGKNAAQSSTPETIAGKKTRGFTREFLPVRGNADDADRGTRMNAGSELHPGLIRVDPRSYLCHPRSVFIPTQSRSPGCRGRAGSRRDRKSV